MLARNHLSAIVVVSSDLGASPTPGILTYSCTKTFSDFLARGLNYELKDRIDCLSWQAGQVATKMQGLPAGGDIVTTEVAVKGMLKDLGREQMTYGCYRHGRKMAIMSVTPQWYFNAFIFKIMKDVHRWQIESGEAEKK